MKKCVRWNRLLSLLLAMVLTTQLVLPTFAADEPQPSEQGTAEAAALAPQEASAAEPVQVELTLDAETKTQTIQVSTDCTVTDAGDPNVVTAELVKETAVTDSLGHTGTDNTYTKGTELLSTALYTFNENGDKWQVSAMTADGTQIWLDAGVAKEMLGHPFATSPVDTKFTPRGSNGLFTIQGDHPQQKDRFLAFLLNDKRNECVYDGSGIYMNEICDFKLYAPETEGQESSTEIPGYVQVNEIQNGGRYLIVYSHGDQTFVMRPSTNTEVKADHVLMVNLEDAAVTTVTKCDLVLTAKAAGETDVVAGDKTYHVTVKDPAKPAPETDPMNIPGYTRVTDPVLNTDKYYLIVAQDSDGNLHAFYPDAASKNAPSGGAVESNKCAAGSFVANLTVDGETVTAQWEKDKSTDIPMNDLCFTVGQNSGKYTFKGANGLYLSLTDVMLSQNPTAFNILAKTEQESDGFTILNTGKNRYLYFNKSGDPKEFVNGATTYSTNFWGPSAQGQLPIFLYTNDHATAPVNTTVLEQYIKSVNHYLPQVTDECRKTMEAELAKAQALIDGSDTKQSQVDAECEILKNFLLEGIQPKPEYLAPTEGPKGTCEGQPFPVKVGDSTCDVYRIPGIVTLSDGTLVASGDARWDLFFDGKNIDTIVSVSEDNGKTWHYNFPNYFNDSTDKTNDRAAVFIDPVIARDDQDTIYVVADAYSAGNWTMSLERITGYEEVNGQLRLVLYTNRRGHTSTNWNYYVGDPGDDGLSPVIAKADEKTAYYVDGRFNLYNTDKKAMYCRQLDTEKFVQQNIFYYNAVVHAPNACFQWLVTSKDHGKTWSDPMLLNPQVRRRPAQHTFYGVGPGAGICTSNGTLMLPTYEYPGMLAGFVYTNDHGKTWNRAGTATPAGTMSTESTLVEIDAETVRQFFRDRANILSYTDYKWDGESWNPGKAQQIPGVVKCSDVQLAALRCSEPLDDGRAMILIATAAENGRRTGKIYSLALNKDGSMELLNAMPVTAPGAWYAYCSLTELKDGTAGLLYEDSFSHPACTMKFVTYTREQLLGLETVEVTLNLDQAETARFPVSSDSKIASNTPAGIVDAKLEQNTNSGNGHTGTNSSYTGPTESLSSALYTFKQNGDKWQVSAKTADGKMVWLDPSASDEMVGHPVAQTAVDAQFVPKGNDGTFTIRSHHPVKGPRFLAFLLDGSRSESVYDVGGIDMGEICNFKLYAPVTDGQQSSEEVPGYVQVNKIQDGGRYLIVHSYNGQTFVMRPSDSTTDKYAHVLKVVPVETELVLTPVSAGTADVVVDKTTYHVTVTTDSTKPTDPVEPTDPSKPTDPVEPTDPAEPTEPSKPTDPVEPTDPSKPTEPAEPTEPSKPTDPVEPTDSTNPTAPVKPSQKPATPSTGDHSNVLPWTVLVVVSLCGICAILFFNRKKNSGK